MKIVILGAGYAGVFSAVNLSKHEGMEVLLIDKNSYHQLLQQILASGTKRPDEIIFSIKELFQSDVSFKQAFVESIDLETKVISTHDNSKVHYDYLIIALGACSYHYGIKEALKYSLPFRSVDKAIKLNEVVSTLPAGSDIVICGGATGTSLAGALSDTPGSKLKIKLVEAHDSILPGWDRRIVEMVTKSLIENNVEIIAGNLISEIRQASVVLQSGKEIESSLTIWAAGVKGLDIGVSPQIGKTKTGRIIVDTYSRINGFEDVFAIGDISAFSLSSGQIAYQLAQFAVRQARSVVKKTLSVKRKESK